MAIFGGIPPISGGMPAGMGAHSNSGDDGGVGCLGIGTTADTGRPGVASDEVGRLIW